MEPITRNLLPRVSYKRGVFGEGVLISKVDGKAYISVADGANSVVEDVITTVFNNSFFLDVHFSIHDQDVFYFVKDNALKIRDDMDELRRLSGKFNVSQDETNDQGLEVSISSTSKSFCFRKDSYISRIILSSSISRSYLIEPQTQTDSNV